MSTANGSDSHACHAGDEFFWHPDLMINPQIGLVLSGGGIRGLILPGQIAGLEDTILSRFVALAGTSAGALIAVAMWAGVTPHEISAKLSKDVGDGSLAGLFFDWRDYSQILSRLAGSVTKFMYNKVPKKMWDVWAAQVGLGRAPTSEFILGTDGVRFENYVREFILYGLAARGITKKLIEWHTKNPIEKFVPTFNSIESIVKSIRTINKIKSKEEFIKDPGLSDLFIDSEILIKKVIFKEFNSVIYNNILDVYFEEKIQRDPWFPPIFLAICEVEKGQVILFNNLEKEFFNVPIASAVRASAGHPLVFARKTLNFPQSTGFCVDGGVLLNFPAAAIGRQLRTILNNPSLDDWKAKEYAPLIKKPIIIVGLSTTDELKKKVSHIRALWSLHSGGARSRLEFEIAGQLPHFKSIIQTTRNLPSYLNFKKAKRKFISDQFSLGRDHIRKNIKLNVNEIASGTDLQFSVERSMKSVANIIIRNFSDEAECLKRNESYVRTHLFLETIIENHIVMGKKAAMSRGRPLHQFSDMSVCAIKPGTGISGHCFASGSIVFAKIDDIQAVRRADPKTPYLGLSWAEVDELPEDLNFCFAIPIYDFRVMSYSVDRMLRGDEPKTYDHLIEFPTGVTAPVAGVLSIDGRLSEFDRPIGEILQHIVARDVLPVLERFAFDISAVLTRDLSRIIQAPEDGLFVEKSMSTVK